MYKYFCSWSQSIVCWGSSESRIEQEKTSLSFISPKDLLTFLKFPSSYFQADILLFEEEINNVSYSSTNTVHNIVKFLLKSFLLIFKYSSLNLFNSSFNFSGVLFILFNKLSES